MGTGDWLCYLGLLLGVAGLFCTCKFTWGSVYLVCFGWFIVVCFIVFWFVNFIDCLVCIDCFVWLGL